MTKIDYSKAIEEIRKELGPRLTIMGHHYQNQAVIDHADLRGDSLELARKVVDISSEYIVFCGVFFMAESAALLARSGQKVYIPDPSADCSMALMAPAKRVEQILNCLQEKGEKILPLAYVNSSLDVKALVGSYKGAVCTSSNAKTMLKWALDQGSKVLFLPDKCLGENTARLLGYGSDDLYQLDIRAGGKNIDFDKVRRAKVLLWPGHCCIHTRFSLKTIEELRAKYPHAQLIVHPESMPEVVKIADDAGSTSYIIQRAREAKAGDMLIIGTEFNLVDRLARENIERGVKIIPLMKTECSHMARTTEKNLYQVLQSLREGKGIHQVEPEQQLFAPAKAALETMLQVCF